MNDLEEFRKICELQMKHCSPATLLVLLNRVRLQVMEEMREADWKIDDSKDELQREFFRTLQKFGVTHAYIDEREDIILDEILTEQLGKLANALGWQGMDAFEKADRNILKRRGREYIALAKKFLRLFELAEISRDSLKLILETARDLGRSCARADAYLHLIDRHSPTRSSESTE